MWRRWLLALLALGPACADAQQPTPDQIDWIRKNAVAFETVKAGNGFDDLQPQKQLIGDARIVALGEPTHGSREVFQMKHRLLEFLVEELGFSVFSIEANMPEAFRLNDYVLRGQGNPDQLIRGMYFWTWTTEEVREMVEWMRRHNAEVERRGRGAQVKFTGFDVQTPDVAARIVEGFVEKADPGYATAVRKAAKASAAVPRVGRGGSAAVKAAERWQAVVTRLEQNRENYGNTHDGLAIDWAIVNARLVLDAMEVREDAGRSGLAVRDRAMARMVGWILGQSPNARIVLWAHNSHVSRQPGSMGRFLEEAFPGEMVVLGFATGKGSYRAVARSAARGLTNHGLEPPPADSFESQFQASGLPRFILDLRKAVPGSPDSGWLTETRRFRAIGSMELPGALQFRLAIPLREYFDAVVWIEETSAALPLGR